MLDWRLKNIHLLLRQQYYRVANTWKWHYEDGNDCDDTIAQVPLDFGAIDLVQYFDRDSIEWVLSDNGTIGQSTDE